MAPGFFFVVHVFLVAKTARFLGHQCKASVIVNVAVVIHRRLIMAVISSNLLLVCS